MRSQTSISRVLAVTAVGLCSLGLASIAHAGAIDPGTKAAAPAVLPAAGERAGFDAAADYSARFGGRAVLIQRGGQVVFERYDAGWSADKPHPLASGTKTFTGVLAMMAVQDGLLKLDERASDTLTEWKADDRKSKITVRQLLTLSSGLEAGDGKLSAGGGSRLLGQGAADREKRLGLEGRTRADMPDDLAKESLKLACVSEPGTKFQYGPSHFYAFGELLNRKLAARANAQSATGASGKGDGPKNTMQYLEQRIFKDMGIGVARIGRDRAGNPNLPGGAMLTAREWVKFGQFVLDQGDVTDPSGVKRQLLRPELLEQCFVPSASNPAYGLTWWLRNSPEGELAAQIADGGGAGERPAQEDSPRDRLRARLRERLGNADQDARQAAQNTVMNGPDGKPIKVYMAAGLGKQRLYVLPQFDMVVVRFAEATSTGRAFDDRTFLGTILGLLPEAQAPQKPVQPPK